MTSRQQYQKIKRQIQQTQQKTARMLQRIDNTLIGVKQSLNQITENRQNIEKFQKSFEDVMKQLAQKIVGDLSNPLKKVANKQYQHLPCSLPINQLIERILAHEEILIITGAGISAPSGIPTFRGKNGLYDKKFNFEGNDYAPQQFISKAFYSINPQPIWEWIEQIYRLTQTCSPNKIHYIINDIALLLSKLNKKVTVVTQNIDDLHVKPVKDSYLYYNIHGNVKQVRCDNLHFYKYWPYRQLLQKGKEVKCPTCQLPLRPHVLFFDESYGPHYGEEVKNKKFPLVFVIGSSLSTGLCTKFTINAQQVIQINPQPVIQVGRVYQYTKDTNQVLQSIKKALQPLIQKQKLIN